MRSPSPNQLITSTAQRFSFKSHFLRLTQFSRRTGKSKLSAQLRLISSQLATGSMKMHSSSAFVFAIYVLAISVLAIGVSARSNLQSGICPSLNTADNGCIRYVKGFDITGVVTEVDLTFPKVKNECDCIQQCLNRPTTCATWVYKFSTAASVKSGKRTCTLYSQFNLPSAVTIEIAIKSGLNKNINAAEILKLGNNPQAGGLVPQAFKDANLNTTADNAAFSGPVWQLANGQVLC